MSTKSKEVATVATGEQLPDFLRDTFGKGTGLTGLSPEDYIVPRVMLLQGQSDPVKNNLPGAKAGIFWLSVLDQPLGEELDFVIINNKIRVLLLAPMDDGQGILARADDGKTWVPASGTWSIRMKGIREPVKWEITDPDVKASGLLNFGTSVPGDPDSNPAATKFYDYLVYLPAHDTIAVLSLARTAAKKAKDLNGKVQMRRVDMHGQVFHVEPYMDGSGSNTFYNYRFSANGFTDKATFDTVKSLSEKFADYRADDASLSAEGGDGPKSGPSDSSEY